MQPSLGEIRDKWVNLEQIIEAVICLGPLQEMGQRSRSPHSGQRDLRMLMFLRYAFATKETTT